MRVSVSMMAAIMEPQMLPLPPAKDVPPRIVAVITSNSKPTPRVAAPCMSWDEVISADMDAVTPVSINTKISVRSTGNPDVLAEDSWEPTLRA